MGGRAFFTRGTALAVILIATGALAQSAPPRGVHDIVSLLTQYKPDAARSAAAQEILARPVPTNALRQNLIAFHRERARVAEALGMAERELQERRLALEAGLGTGEDIQLMNELSARERVYGNYANAVTLFERQLRLGGEEQMFLLARLAMVGAESGDLASAKSHFAKAETAYRADLNGPQANWSRYLRTAFIECVRAQVLGAEGRLAEAETAYRAAIASIVKDLEVAEARARRFSTSTVAGTTTVYNHCESLLVRTLAQQGRLAEAEYTIRNQIRRLLTNPAGLAPTIVFAVTHLAGLVLQRGQWKDAEALARAALRVSEQQGARAESVFALDARRMLANVLVGQSRWADGLKEFETINAAAGAVGAQQRYVRGSTEWAIALLMNARANDARAMLETLLRDTERQLGATTYDSAEVRGVLGMTLAAAGERERALTEYRIAIPLLVAGVPQADPGDSDALRARKLAWILESYLALVMPSDESEVVQNAFRLPDAMRGGSVQRAVADSAARAATGDVALAALVRKEQDLRHESNNLYESLLQMVAAPAQQQLPKAIDSMRSRIESITMERARLQEEIGRRFPTYGNLVRPRTPTVTEARAAMRAGEVLLLVHVGETNTFVWAVAQDGLMRSARVSLGAQELARKVISLRRTLDPTAYGVRDAVPAFDLATAHELYAKLLWPIEATWKGAAHLIVVANGPLAQIPFGLLPTKLIDVQPDPQTLFAEYKPVPWLVRQLAVSQLPSVSALVTLRALPAGRSDRLPFAGFGDPIFSKTQTKSASDDRDPMSARGVPIAMRGSPRGFEFDSSLLAQLPRLPDTAHEILNVARALSASDPDSVFLDLRANESAVKTRNLANRKVVMFATHGLVPGELDGLMQPALALTAPSVAGVEGDGLLTLEEILSLKLDADWVVLSACNTAAGDGAGAEAVSGLGRAFFYAGTRALLVSNWPVETVSAMLITTGAFSHQARHPGQTRAEALRQSMLDLIDNGVAVGPNGKGAYSYAHPLFWAPFSLIGDGG